MIEPLIVALKQAIPMLVRSAPSTGNYLEGVLSRQDLQRCYALLSEAFGPPAKDFGKPAMFEPAIYKVVQGLGGVRAEQCLFLKLDGSQMAYAALWPWASDPVRITLKIGRTPALQQAG